MKPEKEKRQPIDPATEEIDHLRHALASLARTRPDWEQNPLHAAAVELAREALKYPSVSTMWKNWTVKNQSEER